MLKTQTDEEVREYAPNVGVVWCLVEAKAAAVAEVGSKLCRAILTELFNGRLNL